MPIPYTPSASEAILGDYFGVKVKLEQFYGQWLKLEDESLTRLGAANNRIGVNMIAGARVWDNQSKFRLKFGPLTFNEFAAFLPIGVTATERPPLDRVEFLLFVVDTLNNLPGSKGQLTISDVAYVK